MAFFGKNTLKTLLESTPPESKKIIEPYCQDNIKNGAYELCLGEQVFQTDSNPKGIKKLSDKQEIYIAPGQFALLLTEEIVNMPEDKIAFISIKASIKFKGLVNVSGFHVDPGFEGKLLFSVYNAGPSKIVLQRGQKCFPIWFADLNDTQDYKGEHEPQLNIPLDPVAALSQGDLASPSALLEKIKDNYKELETKINSNNDAQSARVNLLDRDYKATDYLVKTALGIAILILFKFIFDWVVYSHGLSKGAEIKQKEINADSSLNQVLLEKKKLLIEIYRLQNLKDSLSTNK